MRTPTSLRSSIAPVKRHSERHNHQLFSVCFFVNFQNTKPSSKEIGRGSMWQYQTVQWADESRKNPSCWLLWELPIKLFSTSATPSVLLPPSPLIKSCSIISVLFLQYFLPLSNSDSTCSSNNSPNNNPAILAPTASPDTGRGWWWRWWRSAPAPWSTSAPLRGAAAQKASLFPIFSCNHLVTNVRYFAP